MSNGLASIGKRQNSGDLTTSRTYFGHSENVGFSIISSMCEILSSGIARTTKGNYSYTSDDDLSKVKKRIEHAKVLSAKIHQISELSDDWDGSGALAPNNVAVTNATQLVEFFRIPDFFPYKVAPSVDGGIGFTFEGVSGRAYIECANGGELFAACYGLDVRTQTWEFALSNASAQKTLGKIKQVIGV